MAPKKQVAIVGAGQAAARTVQTLRAEGFDGAVTIIGAEPELPYERPPLSKEALFGSPAPAPATIHDESFYEAHAIDLMLGREVDSIDPRSGEIRLRKGGRIVADRIVLATGTRARVPRLPGIDAERVLTLRSISDARRLRDLLSSRPRLLIVGGGFIGLEIAAGAQQVGCEVAVVESRDRLIERALSHQVSALLHSKHAVSGVDIRTGCSILNARQGLHEVEVKLTDGSAITADLIVAGVGAIPNDELGVAAGLACSNGVDVALDCRTSAPNIWAVGDVANRVHVSWGSRVRLESWDNAEHHGAIAGRSIARSWTADSLEPAIIEKPAWFWTDQYDLNLQILGNVSGAEQTIVRSQNEGAVAQLFHFNGGVLRGVELLQSGREKNYARTLLQGGWPLPPEKLGDMGMSLKELCSLARDVTNASS